MDEETAVAATLESTPEEGMRLARAALAAGLQLRLVGGVAVWSQCPSAHSAPLTRTYGDADFVGRVHDRKEIAEFMAAQGYEPDKLFNAIHGATRLNFHDPVRGRPIDILLDKFMMCHELDLRTSCSEDGLAIGVADLLLTKLQVISVNLKDLIDIAALLLDHDFAHEPKELSRILEVTHSDWGFEHTIGKTLQALRERLDEVGLAPAGAQTILRRADELSQALDGAPKSAKWKLRARVGERVRWYEEPEEARG